MRLYEISPQNSAWIILNNFNQRYTTLLTQFSNIKLLASTLIQLKRKSKFPDVMQMILEFNEISDDLLSILKRSPMVSDDDIVRYRQQIQLMKNDLIDLSNGMR